ncbi:MAG: FkbM family methyltransferase [Verrucomicrobiae bacterium]|nr:FkbM family methyltransferase [Verrucomicrobiae bacterium]
MTTVLRSLTRTIVPRRIRNWLRSPRQTARWILNAWRPPIAHPVRTDWTLRCPRNAVERAFHLQSQDPPQIREFDDFVRHLRAAGRVNLLDVGCHFGIFCGATLHYGAPGSRVLGVDPSSEARAMVARIARLNGWTDRLTFLQAAVGARDGQIELVETGLTGAGYMVLPRNHPRADRLTLPLRTVDSLAQSLEDPPTLVKIDVEGLESDVLAGGPLTFGERRTPLFLELHNAMIRERGADPAAVLDRLSAFGYRTFLIGDQPCSPPSLLEPPIARFLALHPRTP